MFEELNAHRLAVQENIEKAFEVGFTGNEDLEKAHQVGDIHPNGKWVWTQLPSGKYDWRVIKKQSQSTVPSQQNVNKQQKTEDGLTKEELEELRALESAARKGYKLLQRDANRLRRLQAKERELKQGDNSTKISSSKQAVDVVLTNEDYDRVFHEVGLSRQTPFEHNNKLYILKIFGKRFDGSYLISVHNGDTGKKLQGDSNIAISVKRAFINQLKQEKLRDIERNAKKKQDKSTDDTQSDDKVKLTEGDFKKGVVEKDEYARKNAIDLHDYTGKSIEYYTDNGEKKKAQPYISEFYDSAKQDAVGGYEAYFDRADSIGTFRTLKEAISALETWINNMRVKGHAKPKWIYNESGGRYQMNYRLN